MWQRDVGEDPDFVHLLNEFRSTFRLICYEDMQKSPQPPLKLLLIRSFISGEQRPVVSSFRQLYPYTTVTVDTVVGVVFFIVPAPGWGHTHDTTTLQLPSTTFGLVPTQYLKNTRLYFPSAELYSSTDLSS